MKLSVDIAESRPFGRVETRRRADSKRKKHSAGTLLTHLHTNLINLYPERGATRDAKPDREKRNERREERQRQWCIGSPLRITTIKEDRSLRPQREPFFQNSLKNVNPNTRVKISIICFRINLIAFIVSSNRCMASFVIDTHSSLLSRIGNYFMQHIVINIE